MSLDCRIENFERKIFVKGEFSVSFLRVGKKHNGKKNEKNVETGGKWLCKLNIRVFHSRPVEKGCG